MSRPSLDLNDAALLVRVVASRSFSAAAKERGLPVSTVSRRIARLEASLGVRLLERTTRRLRLTDAGRTYFAHAERAVDDLAQGGQRVRELTEEPRGRIRITSPIGFGPIIIPAVHAYLARHPAVSIELNLEERRVDLLGEGFDIAFRTGRVDSGDFVARELWRSTRQLFASPRYLAERGTPRRIVDLARHACIATHAADGRAVWTLQRSGRGRRHRHAFEPRLFVNETFAAIQAAVHGVGIALLPATVCAEETRRGGLVRVLDAYEGEPGGVFLLYRAHRSITAAVRTCVAHFLAELPAVVPTSARATR